MTEYIELYSGFQAIDEGCGVYCISHPSMMREQLRVSISELQGMAESLEEYERTQEE